MRVGRRNYGKPRSGRMRILPKRIYTHAGRSLYLAAGGGAESLFLTLADDWEGGVSGGRLEMFQSIRRGDEDEGSELRLS